MNVFDRSPATFSLLILPALTPPDYDIKIYNQKFFWTRRDFVGDALVGISCATGNARESYALADRFRRAGSVVVMGGTHPSIFSDESLQHGDAVVVGEAESVWGDVIKDYENRTLKKIYTGVPLDDYFSVSYDYFLKVDPRILYRSGLLLSRGCRYCCDFCTRPFGKLRFVKIPQAVELVRRIKAAVRPPFGKRPTILFRDDNIFSDPSYAKSFFKELIPLGVDWVSNSSVDIAFDEEALSLARASGCRGLFIGFETIYPDKMQKTSAGNMRTTDDYLKAIRKIKSYGIRITGSFILGFDYYTHRDYVKLLWFLARSGLYLISLTILTPFPGSRLYDRLEQEGRITCYDWRRYDVLHHVVFRPKHTSALALQLWFFAIRTLSLFMTPCFFQLAFFAAAAFLIPYYLAYYVVRH